MCINHSKYSSLLRIKEIELNRKNEKFNWESFNKHIMIEPKVTENNFIGIRYFEKLIEYKTRKY